MNQINYQKRMEEEIAKVRQNEAVPKLLLHSCCGPCSTACIERLAEQYDITVFFYNPCITDYDEYEKRKDSQISFLEAYNAENKENGQMIRFVEGDYEPERYLERVQGLENEPEGVARCEVCFRQRLEKTAGYAAAGGFFLYTTTLTVSPHKNFKVIAGIGQQIAEGYDDLQFLDIDFKKKDGFRRSVVLSKKYGLYRQNSCGCVFSERS